MCVAPVKVQCQLETEYGVCVIQCNQADMVHGYQQWQDMLAPSMSTTDMCGIQTHSAADVARELDIHWEVHRIFRDQLDYREVCALGAKESDR